MCAVEAKEVGEKSAEEKFFDGAREREAKGERKGTEVTWEMVAGQRRQLIRILPMEEPAMEEPKGEIG